MKEPIGSGRLSKIVYVAGVLRVFVAASLAKDTK